VPATADIAAEKRGAAGAAADLVADGMTVGLGTGSTVAYLLPTLAERDLSIRCVATSPRTESAARAEGLLVEPFERLDVLDIAIDGADQVAPDGWLVKGGGGAHTREKIVAAAAERFIVIVDSSKLVERITAPIPLELQSFGLRATLRALGEVELRDADPTPDGGLLADYRGDVGDPASTAERLIAIPGVVEHGLFPATLVSEALIGRGGEVERLAVEAR
jgi:ribose 5-phosphate isomerase A